MTQSPDSTAVGREILRFFKARDWLRAPKELRKVSQISSMTPEWIEILMTACSRSMKSFVKLLIEKGIDVDVELKGQNTLCNAMDGPSLPIIKMLLDAGVRRNLKNGFGRGPVSSACANTDLTEQVAIKFIKVLAAAGVPLDEPDVAGFTPLDNAVDLIQHVPAMWQRVKCMIDLGACIRNGKESGGFALRRAATLGQANVVQLLLDAGAPIPLASNGIDTLVDDIHKRNFPDVVVLLQKADLNGRNRPLPISKPRRSAATAPFEGIYSPDFPLPEKILWYYPRKYVTTWLLDQDIVTNPKGYSKDDWLVDVEKLSVLRMEIKGDHIIMTAPGYRLTFLIKSPNPRPGGGMLFNLVDEDVWAERFELVIEGERIRLRAIDPDYPRDRYRSGQWKRISS